MKMLFGMTRFVAWSFAVGRRTAPAAIEPEPGMEIRAGRSSGRRVAGFDDSKWDGVGLPHSFSTPYFQGKDFLQPAMVGIGNISRFPAPGWAGAYARIRRCVSRTPKVFVKRPADRRAASRSGYTGFSFDITPALHAGGKCAGRERLNNRWSPTLAPPRGRSYFSWAAYTDVWLVVTAPFARDLVWHLRHHASGGRRLSARPGQTEIQNQGSRGQGCRGGNGDTGSGPKTGRPVFLPADHQCGRDRDVWTQTSPAIPNPAALAPGPSVSLYGGDDAVAGGNAVDEYRTPFGIGGIKWTADQGFFINGEHYYFHGANVHQDHAGWANAVTTPALIGM